MSATAAECTHRGRIAVARLSEDAKAGLVCAACVAEGGAWVHLRQCRTCGTIGCCDDSPGRHARAHAEQMDHPIITSAEPREHWSYCYVEGVLVRDR